MGGGGVGQRKTRRGRIAMGDALSASVQLLFEKLASAAVTELGKLYGVKEELEKLQRTLKSLRAALHDADRKQTSGTATCRLWLQELKDAACDAEDVVDEFEYEDLRRKVLQNGSEGSSGGERNPLLTTSRKLRKFCFCLNPRELSFRHRMAYRIDEIRKRLGEISKDKKDLDMASLLDAGEGPIELRRQARETTSYLTIPKVIGREEVKSRIMNFLLEANTEDSSSSSSSSPSSASAAAATAAVAQEIYPGNLSVLTIVGMGGLGKTTLAQLVYNDRKIAEYFPQKIWIHVSPYFNIRKGIRQILEHVTYPHPSLHSTESLNVLQHWLEERLKGKRFLLVLDDVWEESCTQWHRDLLAPLVNAERGSKLLITTRDARVARLLHSKETFELDALSSEDCWSLFRECALADCASSQEYPRLEAIGKQISEKLNGVPLAITTIGGLLHSQWDEGTWREVLKRETWEVDKGGGNSSILHSLRLSYEQLPLHLKQCFAYCSVFPKGHKLDVPDVVEHWMAMGYIQDQGRRRMEDVGTGYFDDLLSRSLIQSVNGRYVLHDLLHDLGQQILQNDFSSIEAEMLSEIPTKEHHGRHLLLLHRDPHGLWMPEKLQGFKKLRSFMILFYCKVGLHLPRSFFTNLEYLRVLVMAGCNIQCLPDCIGGLKHLRFLDLRGTDIKCLPESLCGLYKLQTLTLQGCNHLGGLPKGMGNLINLRHLEAEPGLISGIHGIGKLTCLQEMEVFPISDGNGIKIGDLKDMNEIRGKLCIQNLQRVKSDEEARHAALGRKQYLDRLEMEWAGNRDADYMMDSILEESIIEVLHPPPYLKDLAVKYYAGIKFPSWMNNNLISSLESLRLHRCIGLEFLPFNIGQFRFLATLEIVGSPQLKELPLLPQALRELVLHDLGLDALPRTLRDLPLLVLDIRCIAMLGELPALPTTLKRLRIKDVGLRALPDFSQCFGLRAAAAEGGGNRSVDMCHRPTLSILEIHGCPSLASLREGLLRHPLRDLQVLSIKDCEELADWPQGEGFCATLRELAGELSIERCPKLGALPEGSALSASLKKLSIRGCPRVPTGSLFRQLHNLGSENVHVERLFPNLASCSDEALQHLMAVDWLAIHYEEEEDGLKTDRKEEEEQGSPSSVVSLAYDKVRKFSWRSKGGYLFRRVSLLVRSRRRWTTMVGGGGATIDDDDASLLLSRCLLGGGGGDGGRPYSWTSSLRLLSAEGVPGGGFPRLDRGSSPPRADREEEEEEEARRLHPLRFLEELWISGCRDMRKIPTETLMLHIRELRELRIRDCPQLTLPSVEEGIRSLPSLRALWLTRCPNLLQPSPSSLWSGDGSNISSDGEGDGMCPLPFPSRSPPPPPPPLPPARPFLQELVIDDTRLLPLLLLHTDGDGGRPRLGAHLVSSLRVLCISGSELTSLKAAAEEGLRRLAPSLQCLVLDKCPNLRRLPSGLRCLLPSLKVLDVIDCPGIPCLPEEGLPGCLEMVLVRGCPALAGRCRPRQKDWPKIAGVPLIRIGDEFVQGSYRLFLETKDKWDFIAYLPGNPRTSLSLDCLVRSAYSLTSPARPLQLQLRLTSLTAEEDSRDRGEAHHLCWRC